MTTANPSTAPDAGTAPQAAAKSTEAPVAVQTASQSAAPAGTPAATPSATPSATIEELEAIHGNDAAAALASLKAKHTRVQALEAANANLRLRVEQLAQGAAANQAAPQVTGGKPAGETRLTTAAPGVKFKPATAGTQLSAFELHVREYMQKNSCPRPNAVQACEKLYPEDFKLAYAGELKGAAAENA